MVPPIRAVLPSDVSATAPPKSSVASGGTGSSSLGRNSEPCWSHVEPDRTKTQTAPMRLLARRPATRAVLPSRETVTRSPRPIAPAAVNLGPTCVHVDPERANTHAAPGQVQGDVHG